MSTDEPREEEAGCEGEGEGDNATSVATLAAKGVGRGGENWGVGGEAVVYPATHFVTPGAAPLTSARSKTAPLLHGPMPRLTLRD